MKLADWWEELTLKWFNKWFEWFRRHPEVSYSEFKEIQKEFNNYKNEIDKCKTSKLLKRQQS